MGRQTGNDDAVRQGYVEQLDEAVPELVVMCSRKEVTAYCKLTMVCLRVDCFQCAEGLGVSVLEVSVLGVSVLKVSVLEVSVLGVSVLGVSGQHLLKH